MVIIESLPILIGVDHLMSKTSRGFMVYEQRLYSSIFFSNFIFMQARIFLILRESISILRLTKSKFVSVCVCVVYKV